MEARPLRRRKSELSAEERGGGDSEARGSSRLLMESEIPSLSLSLCVCEPVKNRYSLG